MKQEQTNLAAVRDAAGSSLEAASASIGPPPNFQTFWCVLNGVGKSGRGGGAPGRLPIPFFQSQNCKLLSGWGVPSGPSSRISMHFP